MWRVERRVIGASAATLLLCCGAVAGEFPAGEGRKIGPEELERLTALGREISTLTPEDRLRLEQEVMPAPEELAVVLNNGYGERDRYPVTVARFEQLLEEMKAGGYNTLFCAYKDWRVPLMRKHGIKMMVDITAWLDDTQNDIRDPRLWQRPRVKELCERVRNDRVVWGYNIFNEPIDHYFRAGGDMNSHICYLKLWDGTHPIWVGTKYSKSVGWVRGNPGCMAWYDYHWFRGFGMHYGHCRAFALTNEERQSFMGRWEQVSNYHNNMYTLNQSIAWGLKTMIWFIGGPWNHGKQTWDPNHYLCQVNREMQPVSREIGLIGRPIAHKDNEGKIKYLEVFSSPERVAETGTPKLDNNGKPVIIGGWWGFPEDHWCQVTQGSVVAGFFKYPDGMDAIYVACHHPAPKDPTVVLDLSNRIKAGDSNLTVGRFDRATGKWQPLPLKNGCVSFQLAAADGQLITVGKALRRDQKTLAELGLKRKAPEWAADALQVAWDLEGPDPEKAIELYQSLVAGFNGDVTAQAQARLAIMEPRQKMEEEGNKAFAAIRTAAGPLGDPERVPQGDPNVAWRKEQIVTIQRVQQAALDLNDTLPTSLGAARARELLERFGIAEVPWDVPKDARTKTPLSP